MLCRFVRSTALRFPLGSNQGPAWVSSEEQKPQPTNDHPLGVPRILQKEDFFRTVIVNDHLCHPQLVKQETDLPTTVGIGFGPDDSPLKGFLNGIDIY